MKGLHLLAVCSLAGAAVVPRQNLPPDETSKDAFSLPDKQNIGTRSAQISDIRTNFGYGPDVIQGGGAFFPTGSYAQQMISYDKQNLFAEAIPWINASEADAVTTTLLVEALGGLHSIQDYKKFYNGFKIVLPDGPYAGILDNGDKDLLFSMERLSAAPFGVARVDPTATLSFTIDDATARNLTTMSLADLQKAGRLFYIDHRDLADIPLIQGRYAAAVDAYFFIHPQSQDFLPLAIRMNRGSNLIYTPADSPTDWLFGKMAFNMNNLWFEQWYHLWTTHYLTDIVFSAAVRTLGQDHPVYGLLDRLGYQTFAIRPAALVTLLQDGGAVDQFFFSRGNTVAGYGSNLYHNGGAGDWLGTEFITNLQGRGLINCTYGPELKHFPYYEDASVINNAINDFLTSYVNSFYASDADIQSDTELAAFVAEATPAQIINFPAKVSTRQDLVAILRHYAMTASVVHGVTNTNEPAHTTATLPYHPMAFYQPLPTQKGLKDIFPLMPNATQAAGQIALLSAFNRPWITEYNLIGTERTLYHMFDLQSFLARTNDVTRTANEKFKSAMAAFSKVVQARTFDANGLSQGMPFIWRVLDPLNVPFYVVI